jgi:antitoxin component YwqK of YwqJK toxin-antitoxin module
MNAANISTRPIPGALWAIAFCGGGVLLVYLFLIPGRQAPSVPVIEAAQSALEWRGDRWYEPGTERPFTGVLVAYYPDGTRQTRSEIRDGFLHGVSEGWHTNGTLQVREHFNEGVSHGPRLKWHENGRKLSETTIVEGQIHGTFTRWHENGTVAERVEMREGQAHGTAEAFYPSTFQRTRAELKQGELISLEHWQDGEMPGAHQMN